MSAKPIPLTAQIEQRSISERNTPSVLSPRDRELALEEKGFVLISESVCMVFVSYKDWDKETQVWWPQ